MEALWSRFLPAYAVLRDLLGEQRVGDPRLVEADFGFRRDIDPAHRLFDVALGGGALLDLGIYTAQLVAMVLGHPDRVVADGAHRRHRRRRAGGRRAPPPGRSPRA